MGLDEYILGLLAIISGLAISEMVGSFHSLLYHRDRVKWDWLTPLAALYIAWSILVSWWVSWQSNHDRTEPMVFGFFILPVAQLVCLFLAGKAVLPSHYPQEDEERLDLAAQYFAAKRYVWLAMAVNIGLLVLARIIGDELERARPGGVVLSLPVLGLALTYFLALALVENRLFHRIALPLGFLALAALTLGQSISG